MEHPNEHIEETERKPLKSGIMNSAATPSFLSEDYALRLDRGIVVCDGVGGDKMPREAAVIVCKVIRVLENRLAMLNGVGNEKFEEEIEDIIATASGCMAVKIATASAATTLDFCYIDKNRRLHVAHRGDGLVVRVSSDIKEAELVTLPNKLAVSLNDRIRGFVSSLGSFQNWGVPDADRFMKLLDAIEQDKKNGRAAMLQIILEKSQFPHKIKTSKEVVDVRERIIKIILEDSEEYPSISEPTEYYHVNCNKGDIVIAMTDGVLDNIACFSLASHLITVGMDEKTAIKITKECFWYHPMRRERKLMHVLRRELRNTCTEEKIGKIIDQCVACFKSIPKIYNDVVSVIRDEVLKFSQKKPTDVDPQALAEYLVNAFQNTFKQDDATCGVVIVD